MSTLSRTALSGLLSLTLLSATAQSGIRFQGLNDQWTDAEVDQRTSIYALGFDHDITPHLAFGVDVGYGDAALPGINANVLVFNYRSYYLTGDNESTSFYLGSYLGLRRYKTTTGQANARSTTSVPLGLRLGVRGGLPGFFMDLFGEAGVQLGGSMPTGYYNDKDLGSLSGLQFRVGVDFGFGWE